jgi:hypothetical protein
MITGMVLAAIAAVQANEQVLETYRKAAEHQARGAYAECLRLCDEIVKLRPDKEGVLRVRVGAGLEDKEFEPRRLAGDALMQQAKNMAELEAKLKLVDSAVKSYQASVDLKLEKSAKLLEVARAEKAKVEADIKGAAGAELFRRKVEAAKRAITEKVVARQFEGAFAELQKSKAELAEDATAWKGLKTDLEATFLRWHDGLAAELREDLAAFQPAQVLLEQSKTAERFARYRIPPEQAAPSRLNRAILWAGRLGLFLEKRPLDPTAGESLAKEALDLGAPHWRAAEGLVLEALAATVRDPGPSSALEARWESVLREEATFAGALERGRTLASAAAKAAEGARKEDLDRWLAEDLPAIERKVSEVRKSLPDRNAPRVAADALARLSDPAIAQGGRRDGYARVERELQDLVDRSRLDAPIRARVLAGIAVSRAYALFLDGLPREQVLERCRESAREALKGDAAAFDSWKETLSPRITWVLDQSKP